MPLIESEFLELTRTLDLDAFWAENRLCVGTGGRLNIATAGSIPAGIGLGRLRWLMHCVQEETRYR